MNMYGPTETAVDCTYHIIEKEREYTTPFFPAGRPCENISIMILLYLIGSILGTIINLVGVSI